MAIMARELTINGYDFHCVEHGQGPPVVLVHGAISDYRTWQAQQRSLAERFHVIAYSRRYHWPNVPIADGADYAMRMHVADLEAVIGALGLGPVHLVGHSYGAFLCLLLACRRPDLAASLVLAEPPVVTLLVSNPPRIWEILALLATRPRTAAALLKLFAGGLGPATGAFRAGDVEKGLGLFASAILGRQMFEHLPGARLQQMRDNLIVAEFLGSGFLRVDPTDVRKIGCPALLVTGADSPALFHGLADRLEELLPRVERADLLHASHLMHEDNPAAFNAAVYSFLGGR
jgi:pimeloyl-ACP methyl ester carboxylesterase